MAGDVQYVLTLGNSIIGVSVLAMPYCFQQCGIILSIILLIGINLMTRIACHLLIKSAIMCRRRNYEQLALATFGAGGKLAVELSMIGFLVGTCVAFFVVIGDLGPAIASRSFSLENTSSLRSLVMFLLAFVVVLPLCLLRNIESLTGIAIFSFLFYFFLVLKVFFASFGHILSNDWMSDVEFWSPSGMLVCIPIFSMALSCQTQVFEIYESMPDASLHKMNSVVSGAVNMCTVIYASVGLFGYLAFFDYDGAAASSATQIPGNILLVFPQTTTTECIKFFYVLSVALSFPLVLFPCRASIHSLLFPPSQQPASYEMSAIYIPDSRFRAITLFVLLVSLALGLLLPAIEVVLSLMGSTIGIIICLIFPAMIFIRNTTKNTNERRAAQTILCIGVFLMVAGTYTNLMAMDSNYALDAAPVEKLMPEAVPVLKELPTNPKDLPPPVDPPSSLKDPSAPVEAARIDVLPSAVNLSMPGQGKENADQANPAEAEEVKAVPLGEKSEKPSARERKERRKNKASRADVDGGKRRKSLESQLVVNQPPPDLQEVKKEPAVVALNEEKKPVKEAGQEKKIIHQLAQEQEEQRQILDEQRKLLDELKGTKSEDGKKKAKEEKEVALNVLESQLKELTDLKEEIKKVGENIPKPEEEVPAKEKIPAPANKSRVQEPYVLAKRSGNNNLAPSNASENIPAQPSEARHVAPGEEEICPVPGDCPAKNDANDDQKDDRGLR